VTWSVLEGPVGGSITTEGLYTAPNRGRGAFHVLAQSTQDSRSRASATVTVPEAPVGRVAIAPGQVELPKGGSQTFVAVVEGLADPGLAWSCSGGSIDSTGHYTAPARFGTYRVTAASSAHPELRAEATVILAGGTRSEAYSYDLNGNLIGDGERSFQWDAENRLVAVVNKTTGHRSEFEYDGFGRRVGIRELDPDANKKLQVSSDKKYLWDGTEIAEERSADGGTVLKRFYDQGFVDSDGTALFYTRDHLGSIRELTDGQQAVRARYDYDPYGRMTKVSGDKDSPFTYTGHFWHQPSGLNLSLFRAYDPNLGRWISGDPIEEAGGGNLYGYVDNEPIGQIDPLGLYTEIIIWRPVGWGASSAGHVSTNLNGTTFSFGPNGMSTMPTSNYLSRNSFRDGVGHVVHLTPEQESLLTDCLSRKQKKYNEIGNNCGDPIRDCLNSLGFGFSSVFPSRFGKELSKSPFVRGRTNFIKAGHLPLGVARHGQNFKYCLFINCVGWLRLY
jgi:RHS repeat-associated protein